MSAGAVVEPNPATWQIDPVHSTAQFKVKHMMISNVKGEFTSVTGSLQLNADDITQSSVEVTIDATTVNTRDPQRDAHLKSADFLDTERFPTLTFKSTSITNKPNGGWALKGDLSIRGVTRNVTLDVEELSAPHKDPWGSMRIGVTASTIINRKDFGLTWNTALEAGGVLVGEQVSITLDIEFVK